MRFITFCTCLFFLSILNHVQAQDWVWGQEGTDGYGTDIYNIPVATDRYGNVYIAGAFDSILTFSTITLKGPYSGANAYIAKFNSTGKLLWAIQAIDSTDISSSDCEAISTDKNGNVFMTGVMWGTVSFGRFLFRTANHDSYAYIVKCDSNGNILWAKQGITSRYYGALTCALATDNSGNVFLTGEFDSSIAFGPYILKTASSILTDQFIVKYDASGNVRWAKQSTNMGWSNLDIYICSIATDTFGNAYVVGSFPVDSITFGRYTLYNSAYTAVYLIKYSPQGNVLWARQGENASYYYSSSTEGFSVIADQTGNAYITGTLVGEAIFGKDTLINFSGGRRSAFLAKYDTSGNEVWAEQSSPTWIGTGLTADDSNHIYLTGLSTAIYNLDTLKLGSFNIPNPGNSEYSSSFIIKFDTNGKPDCGSILDNMGPSGVGLSQNTGVTSDATGENIYMVGAMYGGAIVSGNDTLYKKAGEPSVALVKWKPCVSSRLLKTPPAPPKIEPVVLKNFCNIFVPDVFSPSQNINNILYVKGACIASMKFLIFDRWGNNVFKSMSLNDGWDGTYAGSPMNMGTYVWYLKATLSDGTNVERKGNVTLVR